MTAALQGLLAAAYFVSLSSDGGVQVFQRLDTHLIELRAEGELDAPPARVLALLLLDYQPQDPRAALAKEVAESRILSRGDHALEVYQRLAMPVVSDRDYTLRVTWGEEGEARWLRFQAANDQGPPPRDGVQRVPVNEGAWALEPLPGNRTYARYQVRLDLGGSIKAWMARDGAGESITALYQKLRQRLREAPAGA